MFTRSVTLTVFLSLSFLAGAAANAAPAKTDTSSPTKTVLPAALRPVLYQTLARDAGPAYAVGKHDCATVPNQRLTACFDRAGIHFRRRDRQLLTLALAGFGRGTQLTPVRLPAPTIHDNTVSYHAGALSAWWRVLPAGFEQGFTIARRPVGSAPLHLVLTADSSSSVTRHADQLRWGALRYGGLVTTDATGKVVPSTLTTKNRQILIAVNDTHATYPLTIDPLVWIEQEVTADDGGQSDYFGSSVALDGPTAIVGAPGATVNGNQDQGAAYVFTESAGTWSQTQKLTASDGAGFDYFGSSVALVGATAIIGAPGATVSGNALQGAAYVFDDSGGSWSQAQKLTASDGAELALFGGAIALDSPTAVIGAPDGGISSQGAAYVFTDSGGTWTQAAELIASDGLADDQFGHSIALDDTAAVVGAPYAAIGGNTRQGAAYVFDDSGGTWSQAQKLTASDGAQYDNFGNSVALAGPTAVIGADIATVGGNAQQGAAYVFTNSGGTWSETQKLTASDGAAYDDFAESVALDGDTVLVGAPGATVGGIYSEGALYLFDDSGGTWVQTTKLTASVGQDGLFGSSATTDGTTALVGAWGTTVGGNVEQGAAFFYAATCPQGYGEHDGTLDAGGLFSAPSYQAPAGIENGILGGPGGFQLYLQYSNGTTQHLYRILGNEIHHYGPAGTYRWGVKAGSTGGDYVLCVLHP